jgi:hypothetical protein
MAIVIAIMALLSTLPLSIILSAARDSTGRTRKKMKMRMSGALFE